MPGAWGLGYRTPLGVQSPVYLCHCQDPSCPCLCSISSLLAPSRTWKTCWRVSCGPSTAVSDGHKPSCFHTTDALGCRSRGQKSHRHVAGSNKAPLREVVQMNPCACFCHVWRPPGFSDSKSLRASSKTVAQKHPASSLIMSYTSHT